MTAVVSVSQNGPSVDPLNCSLISSQPSVAARRHSRKPSAMSLQAITMRERVRGAESSRRVCSEEPELTIMLSRLSDHAAARNSRPLWHSPGPRGQARRTCGGSRDDVLHERGWRYRDLEKILSIYSQENPRLARGASSRGQGGYTR